MIENLIISFTSEHEDYLRDESRRVGEAKSISFPKNENEIVKILKLLEMVKIEVTVQGARTGIAAGAVPQGGHVLNLSKMNKLKGLRFNEKNGCFYLKLEPGVLLSELREVLTSKRFETGNWSKESVEAVNLLKASGKYFFPPDPTETSASIGGMVSCNASGACSFKYGPTRGYIEYLNIILIDGAMLKIKRGDQCARERYFHIQRLPSGVTINGIIPSYKIPNVKNASGFHADTGMDLIDLFIGSEGTLGIITEIEVKLIPEPKFKYGITGFFPCETAALRFIKEIRKDKEEMIFNKAEEVIYKPAAIEFFNSNALKLLKYQKTINPAFNKLLEIKSKYNTAVYIEYHGDNKEVVLSRLIQCAEIMTLCEGDEEDTWVATNVQDMEKLHFFRHSTPEAVNLLIDNRRKIYPELTKLGTDMAVPNEFLESVMEMYNKGIVESGLEAVMFGHIGDNHIHVNIVPRNMEEYFTGKKLYSYWASRVIEMGGTVSAEHGIGKLKTSLLLEMYGLKGITEMKELKTLFDPDMRLNRGNLFS